MATESGKPTSVVIASLDSTRADTDKKSYLLIRLKNGLEALLISDPTVAPIDDEEDDESYEDDDENSEEGASGEEGDEEDDEEEEDDGHHGNSHMSAAAMVVNAGALNELPTDPHGLAHFLEHMLFMGSKKYPKENAYDDRLAKDGGESNAFTDYETTTYYFSVPQPGLEASLDVFAQFFIEPLMSADSTDREIEAVDSEFELSRADDEDRTREILSSTCSETSHPMARNMCGCSKTLRAVPPERLRSCLFDFHAKHYAPKNMKLCVWAKQSLESLRALVETTFESMPEVPAPAETPHLKGLRPPEYRRDSVILVAPINDVHSLQLTWAIPPVKQGFQDKSQVYIAHLLGHESKGSAFSVLHEMNLALALEAGVDEEEQGGCNRYFALFNVVVKLTKQGVKEWRKVVAIIYAAIGVAIQAGPKESIFRQVRDVEELAYRFKDGGDPSDEVCDLATRLLVVGADQAEKYLLRSRLLFEFHPETITEMLARLVPANCRLVLQTSLLGRESQWSDASLKPGLVSRVREEFGLSESEMRIEPRLGARYWIESLPASAMEAWSEALRSGHVTVNGTSVELTMPPETNPFLPASVELRPLDPEVQKHVVKQHPLCFARVLFPVETMVSKTKTRTDWVPALVKDERPGQLFFAFEDGRKAWRAVAPAEESPAGEHCVELASSGKRVALRVVRPRLPYPPTPLPGTSNKLVTTWHLQDADFRVPKSTLNVLFRLTSWRDDAVERVQADLHAAIATRVLTSECYLAEMAMLETSIRVSEDDGVVVSLHGFSDKLPDMLELLMRTMRETFFAPKGLVRRDGNVETEREALLRYYRNAESSPDVQANAARLASVVVGSVTTAQKLQALTALDASALENAKPPRVAKIDCLSHGNVRKVDSTKLHVSLIQTLGSDLLSSPTKKWARPSVRKIPSGWTHRIVLASSEPTELNSSLHVYLQIGPDTLERRAKLELLEQLLSEPMFDALRTKQQIGYMVDCSVRRTHGVLGLSFEMTSVKFSPSEMEKRLEAFLLDFETRDLAELTDGAVASRARALARRASQPSSGLAEVSRDHFQQICSGNARGFDDRFVLANELRRIADRVKSPAKLVREMWRETMPPHRARRALAVWVVGQSSTAAEFEKERQAAGTWEGKKAPKELRAHSSVADFIADTPDVWDEDVKRETAAEETAM